MKEIIQESLRYNAGKLQWSLVHFKSLTSFVKVLMFGAEKYEPDNWKKPMPLDKIQESMMRHMVAIMDGETHDSESKELHVGHIMCNAMFWEYQYNRLEKEKLQASDI
jgi:hypothetical protein